MHDSCPGQQQCRMNAIVHVDSVSLKIECIGSACSGHLHQYYLMTCILIRSVQNCIAEVRKGWKFRSAIQKLLTNMSKLKYCYSFKHIARLSNFTVEVKESLVQRPVLQQPLVAL